MDVSVIIPVYNSKDTLKRAFDSVLLQDHVKEIVLIDDGSSDGSDELCLELSKSHDFVITILQKENKGACAARNIGLRMVSSNWIQFLDADDELLSGKIKYQTSIISKNTAFIVGNAIDVFIDGHQHLRSYKNDVWKGLIMGKLGITSSNLWNKLDLDNVGGWNQNLSSSQEYDLMFRILQKNDNVKFSNYFLTKIYKVENSISRPLIQNNRNSNWLTLRYQIKEYLEKEGRFDLKKQYYFFGAIRLFSNQNNIEVNNKNDHILSYIYIIEINIKSFLFSTLQKLRLKF